MRHRVGGSSTLGRRTKHRLALVQNLATDLLRYERLTTTQAKAREPRGLVEKMITKGKHGTLHDRRQVLSVLTDAGVVRKLFDELAPRYADRPGGYTRLLRLMPRPGDAAPMAMLELV